MRKFILFFIALSLPFNAAATCVCTEDIPLHLEIQALYPHPLEGESEWIELLNTGDDSIDLSFYTLQDATESPFTLEGELGAGASTRIKDLPFQLNNGSEQVDLHTLDGLWIDSLSYKSSEAGVSINKDNPVELAESTEESPSLWPVFSEALPNPEGSDSTEEWIELYNPYEESLSLESFSLDDQEGGSSPHTLEGSIAAHSYLVLSVEDSKLTLNNTTDSIRLLDQDENVLWEILYENPPEGESYASIQGELVWTSLITPGAENESSETSEAANGDLSEEIEITEAYPNPEGPDQDSEWIELTNGGNVSVDLGNWSLDDGPGGSEAYVFPEGTDIAPGETLVIFRKESGIALNNSKEQIQLSDYTGEVMDEIYYEQSIEGQSYSQIEIEESKNQQASLNGLGPKHFTTWTWTTPSPGDKNPQWIQVIGEIVEVNENKIKLFDGLSHWQFTTEVSALSTALYQEGNRLLVQASPESDTYLVQHSELLETALQETKEEWPWGMMASLLGVSLWGLHQYWKREKNVLLLSRKGLH